MFWFYFPYGHFDKFRMDSFSEFEEFSVKKTAEQKLGK